MSKVQSPESTTEDRGRKTAATLSGSFFVRHPSPVGGHRSSLDFGLSVSDLRKSFLSPAGERIEVLSGASFSARPGEAVAVMGRSGAGKSTLLQLLGGLEAPDHGSIDAGGFAVERANAAALRKFRQQRVGFVFQFHHLLADLTAAENVSLPLRINRTSRREAMARAREMLAQVGLDGRFADSVVGHLSGGEQQRVAVCRALVTRPALVLADEPTGNLDTAIGEELADSLVSYARIEPAVVIIATHNQALAATCDRTLVLQNGRLL